MTDPTPTRAEVEALCERLRAWDISDDDKGAAADMIQALHERAEATEAAAWVHGYNVGFDHGKGDDGEGFERGNGYEPCIEEFYSEPASNALQEWEDAAWNDAIEAAAKACLTSPSGEWGSAGAAASRIRALRRAAPTEGEA